MINKEYLKQLLETSSPSGYEVQAAKVFKDYLVNFLGSNNVRHDVMGNTIGVINDKAKFKVMLAGHYDEIGFQVTYISEDGLLSIRRVGGIDNITVPGSEVNVWGKKGKIDGVIGKKPIHLCSSEEMGRSVELKNVWIS